MSLLFIMLTAPLADLAEWAIRKLAKPKTVRPGAVHRFIDK